MKFIWGKRMTIGKLKIPSITVVLITSCVGFLTGVFVIALWQGNWLMQNNIMEPDFLEMVKNLNIDKRALFFLCLGKRLRAFFLLVLLSFSSLNIVCVLAYFGFCGFSIGSVLEVLIIRYGFQGVCLFFTFVLPQGVLYVLSAFIVGCWCLNSENSVKGQRNKKIQKICHCKKKKLLILSLLMIFMGAYLESNINKKIFLMFFNI